MTACDRIVALNVIDEDSYQQYRDSTAAILSRYSGERLYDFRVSDALTSGASHPINRVFLIRFPDKATMDGYFADPGYRAARERYFESAVAGATLIGAYELS